MIRPRAPNCRSGRRDGQWVTDIASWIDRELGGSRSPDECLGKRLRSLVHQLSAAIGRPLPLACGDWASFKAAYRFLSNDDVSEDQILAGHFVGNRPAGAAC